VYALETNFEAAVQTSDGWVLCTAGVCCCGQRHVTLLGSCLISKLFIRLLRWRAERPLTTHSIISAQRASGRNFVSCV